MADHDLFVSAPHVLQSSAVALSNRSKQCAQLPASKKRSPLQRKEENLPSKFVEFLNAHRDMHRHTSARQLSETHAAALAALASTGKASLQGAPKHGARQTSETVCEHLPVLRVVCAVVLLLGCFV